MNNFKVLVLVQLREIFTLNRKNKKDVTKAIGLGSALAALFALCLFISATYNYLIYDTYRALGDTTTYLPLVYVLSSMVILVTGLIKVKATLFGNKDYNMLESMPIKHWVIIASKIFVVYLYELVFAIGFMAPAIVIMAVKEFDLATTLISVFAMLTLPVVPILIGGLIGLPMAFLFDKTKYGSIVSLVLYVFYIIALMYFVYGKSTPEAKGAMYASIVLKINKFYFVSKFFTEALAGNMLSAALFGGIQILVVAIFILLASLTYKPINDNIMSKNIKVNYESKALKKSGIRKALILKDIRKITSSPNLLLNSLLGGIMSIMMTILMYVSLKQGFGEQFNEFKSRIFPFLIITMCFGLGISPISAANISLEGGSFWILKTAPIDERRIIRYKLLISIFILVPFQIAASCVLVVLFRPSIIASIMAFAIPLLYVLVSSYIGMVAQLHFPNIHFKNELEVLKRGAAAMLSTFLGMGIDILMAGAIVGLGIFVNMTLAYAVICGVVFAIIVALAIYLRKRGAILFNNIA